MPLDLRVGVEWQSRDVAARAGKQCEETLNHEAVVWVQVVTGPAVPVRGQMRYRQTPRCVRTYGFSAITRMMRRAAPSVASWSPYTVSG